MTTTEQPAEDRGAIASDLANRFAYHAPDTSSRVEAHEQVRAECYALAAALTDLVPPGRERDNAWDAVELAMFWGNAGIARRYRTGAQQGEALVEFPRPDPQQVRPDPVPGGTQNPASLVGTEDMPAPDGAPEPLGAVAPARNVTEQAEAPTAPPLAPEHADEPIGGQPDPVLADPDAPASP